MKNIRHTKSRSPWAWIPTLYFAQGLPYVAVMTLSVIMYKRLGISNTDIALYTGWLYLPWVIKPFWSPFVDIVSTKRRWTIAMQWLIAVGLAGVAFSIPVPFFFQLSLGVFWLVAFTSATHDIASDGFYMLALSEHEQSLYVGIRSTFYRIATVTGQGLLVVIAGLIESNTGATPLTVGLVADPGAEWAPVALTGNYLYGEDPQDEFRFFASVPDAPVASKAPATVTVERSGQAVEIPFAEYSTMMLDSVRRLNEANGFSVPDVRGTSARASSSGGGGAFTSWVRNTFGEKRQEVSATPESFAVVGVRLSQQPPEGEDIVLNVSRVSGDEGIVLEQNTLSPRLVFNSRNWDKTAYLFFRIDHKITGPVSATFSGTSGNVPFAWCVVFCVLSAFFFIVAIYHGWALPRPSSDSDRGLVRSASQITREFIDTFNSFFRKDGVITAIAFMLLYRLPEAQLVKLINPFLLDPVDKGGMGLSTGEVGIVYGTVGIIGLTLGGIIGGIVAAKGGLKKWLMPMAWSMSLTCLTFVYMSYASDVSLAVVNICVFVEQFGYGFGFTAYMLYLIYFSEGTHKTAHYAICTGFMALGMMLPGMAAGWLQDTIGYSHFFIWTMICCVATIAVASRLKINPQFGLKKQ